MDASRLDVVGLGLNPWWQVTVAARQMICDADEVLYLIDGALEKQWIEALNPASRSLGDLYADFEHRRDVYDAMVDRIMERLRAGGRVCAAFYGHPGVFVDPGHEVVRAARAEGFRAAMYPAVSAADCMYADIGFDPGARGCQSYEATAFLRKNLRRFDNTVDLILWQVGAAGELSTRPRSPARLQPQLAELLVDAYGPEHVATIYEAATQPAFEPRVETVALEDLADATLRLTSTLYVPGVSHSAASATS